MSKAAETVAIIGAGLSGLACGYYLKQADIPFRILEACDDVGGRVRTDKVDGFLLDRGFQVFLTAYPECQNLLNYDELKLKPFASGAKIFNGHKFHTVIDPWDNLFEGLLSGLSPIGTPADKLRVAQLRNKVLAYSSVDEIFQQHEFSSLQFLQNQGFSIQFIEQFFTPFLGGIFFDKDLKTSSRMLEFVFRMFSSGETTLPENGIGALAQQLAENVGHKHIRLNTKMEGLTNEGYIDDGIEVKSLKTVVATDWPAAKKLITKLKVPASRSVTNLYFSANQPPDTKKLLMLNGAPPQTPKAGCVNNVTVLSQVQPSYAPAGQELISVTVLANSRCDDETLASNIKTELTDWFGNQVKDWTHLKTYRIRHALPQNFMPNANLEPHSVRYNRRILICGDYLENPSFNGAMVAGRRAAEAIISELGK